MEHLFKLHRGNEAKVSMRKHYVENEMKIHNCGMYLLFITIVGHMACFPDCTVVVISCIGG